MPILDRAELLLQASEYSGTGAWLDQSGNGHDGQLGSTSGDDTNDPLFKDYDGDQYTYLPGTASNYMSLPDTNLLDADTAHLAQSIGQWAIAGDATGAYVPDGGDYGSLTMAVTGASSPRWNIINQTIAVSDGPITLSLDVNNLNGAARDIRLRIYLDSVATDTTVTVPAGISRISTTGKVVSGETNVTHLWVEAFNDEQIGDDWVFSKFTLSLDTSTTFIPSLRIVGDLDGRMKLSVPDLTPAANSGFINRYQTATNNRAFRWIMLSTGAPQLVVSDDGIASDTLVSGATLSGQGVVVDVPFELGFTLTAAGAFDMTLNGSAFGTQDTTALVPLFGGAAPLQVGAGFNGTSEPLAGDVFWSEIRDGIDGPVVGRYDSGNAVEPYATVTDDYTDSVWTINRDTSGPVTTVIDQSQLVFTTDDYVEVADHADLDFAADESFTLLAAYRQSFASAKTIVAKKSNKSTSAGYILYATLDGKVTGMIADGAANSFDQTSITDPLLNVVGGAKRDVTADTVTAYKDGVASGSPATDTTTATLALAGTLRIGEETDGSDPFEGSVMAVALFREALTDAEILEAGKELDGTIPGSGTYTGMGPVGALAARVTFDGNTPLTEAPGLVGQIVGSGTLVSEIMGHLATAETFTARDEVGALLEVIADKSTSTADFDEWGSALVKFAEVYYP